MFGACSVEKKDSRLALRKDDASCRLREHRVVLYVVNTVLTQYVGLEMTGLLDFYCLTDKTALQVE